MHEDSLIAQRIVQDHVKSLKLEAYEVKVTKTCLDNANSARRRCFDVLKQKFVSNKCSERWLLSTTQEKIQIYWQKKAFMRTTLAEMKSSLSESNVLK